MDISQRLSDLKDKVSSTFGKSKEEVEQMLNNSEENQEISDSKERQAELSAEQQVSNLERNIEKLSSDAKYAAMQGREEVTQALASLKQELQDLKDRV